MIGAGNIMSAVPHLGNGGYPEAYSKGSERLQEEARYSPMAQGYRRGQDTSQRKAIRPIYTRANNQKAGGYTAALQQFPNNIGPSSGTPSTKQSFSMQRVSIPSINMPSPVVAIPTAMPWNR